MCFSSSSRSPIASFASLTLFLFFLFPFSSLPVEGLGGSALADSTTALYLVRVLILAVNLCECVRGVLQFQCCQKFQTKIDAY